MCAWAHHMSSMVHTHRAGHWEKKKRMNMRVCICLRLSPRTPSVYAECVRYCKNALPNNKFHLSSACTYMIWFGLAIIIVVDVDIVVVASAKLFDTKSLLMLMHINTVASRSAYVFAPLQNTMDRGLFTGSTRIRTTRTNVKKTQTDWKLQQHSDAQDQKRSANKWFLKKATALIHMIYSALNSRTR